MLKTKEDELCSKKTYFGNAEGLRISQTNLEKEYKKNKSDYTTLLKQRDKLQQNLDNAMSELNNLKMKMCNNDVTDFLENERENQIGINRNLQMEVETLKQDKEIFGKDNSDLREELKMLYEKVSFQFIK